MMEWLIPMIIILSMLIMFMTGMAVSFALVGVSAVLFVICLGPDSLMMMVSNTANQITQEVFLAIPLFVFMAAVLQFSGVSEDLYAAMYSWLGPVNGGLCMGTIIICALIAAMSGIGATGTITMGLIAMPEMLKRGYDKKMVLGAITVGGALGPLIPPSVLMVIVGGYAQLSVGKLFMGGVVPGLMSVLFYCLYIGIRCAIHPQDGPALPLAERATLKEKIFGLRLVIMPILLVVALMGSIYSGIATPTEAASVGAAGALIIATIHRRLHWNNLREALLLSTKVTCMVMWLLIGGGCYSSLITVSGTGTWVANQITSMNLGPFGVELVILTIVLIMGMFMDSIAITMICLPIFIPIVTAMQLDMFTMMLLFTVATIIGLITPPFGMNLFYMRGIAKDASMKEIYNGTIPYALLQIVVLFICLFFPSIMTYLPNLMG
jgi:tripartite ATP-independent transporter DctM subunit